jgi:poly-gamma-glutamate synthesis protein (capsule biosynthesis protein)
MTGRGLDQALSRPVDPELREPWVRDARRYLELAERASGPVGAPLRFEQVWGDALRELADAAPDVRIANLETSLTTSSDFWPGKGIHYRMHPANVGLLRTAGLDLCVLANNHVMDFGRAGLRETLATLRRAGLGTVGAGLDAEEATAPSVVATDAGRLLVVAFGSFDAGVPPSWRARPGTPGVAVLDRIDDGAADAVVDRILDLRRDEDRVVVSLHWGSNWGYDVPAAHRRFAHRLIDAGAADLIFGHSSHHPRPIEVYRGRAILYGAGDLLNDYEGIGGHEAYRPELSLLHLPELAPDGTLTALLMVPMRIRRLRLERAPMRDARWLAERLDGAARPYGTRVDVDAEARLVLAWG